jgi:hypothetical protein
MTGRFFDPRPMLAQVLLATGRAQEALDLVRESSPRVVFSDSEGGAVAQQLLHAEALWALGRPQEAQAAIAAARCFVLDIAEKVEEQALRRSFLERVPDVARILKCAEKFGTPP